MTRSLPGPESVPLSVSAPLSSFLMTARAAGRERLDRALVTRGLVPSREQAGRLILAGAVRLNGIPAVRRDLLVSPDATIEVTAAPPYVSRSGGKLAAALDAFAVDPAGVVALDVGASTGGFTDCLLQRSVRRVYAVDVGYGQLDWRLRQDPRVVVLERRNIRHLKPSAVPEPVELAVIDVSFISLTLVLPSVLPFLAPGARIIALIKPQFEVGRGQVGRGGIVRDESLRRAATDKILMAASRLGLAPIGVLDSPIHGQKGNREVLIGLRWPASAQAN
jgi:23S rRNA (cytidine1920-2'-O)/16S rRNA (cytidine1409-2'-O)-methyltransferase